MIGIRNSVAAFIAILGLSSVTLTSCGSAQEAKLRKAILEVSKSDKDATSRLLNIFVGGEDKPLGIKKGCYSVARRRVSWLAFGEIFYHPLSLADLEQILAYIVVLQRYPPSWPEPMRWKQAFERWGDKRMPGILAGLSNEDESVRLKSLMEARLIRFRWRVSDDNDRKLRKAATRLHWSKDQRVQLEAWRLYRHAAFDEGEAARILEALKTATGELRRTLFEAAFGSTHRNARRHCLKQVMKDLGGQDLALQESAFMAVSGAWRYVNRRLSSKDKQTLQAWALHYISSDRAAAVFAALKVLDKTAGIKPIDRPTKVARTLLPIAGSPDPYVRERLISIVKVHCSQVAEGRKILTDLTKDPDAAVRSAAKKALKN